MKLYFGGKITVCMIGAYCEDYISGMFSEGINLWDIRNEKGAVYAGAKRKDYLRIARLSRAYGVRVRVTGKKGLYYRAAKITKRPWLIAGCFISVIGIILLRDYVWHIDIHGNNDLTESFIYKKLEEYGITAGINANGADTLNAERKMMSEVNGLGWINIEINGSRADVYINETKSGEREDIDIKIPCNVVAARSGIITDSKVYSGTMLYEKGSGVAEGNVIVSGTVVNDSGGVILVHADAEVIADFTETAEFSMDCVTTEKVPSGESVTAHQLMLLGFVFPLGDTPADTSNTVCTETVQGFSFMDIPLPVKLKTDTYTKYKDISVERKESDIRKLLEQRLEDHCRNFYGDYEIRDIKKEYEAYEGGLKLKAKIYLRGNIAEQRIIYTK